MLAAGASGVESSSKGKVKGHQVFVGADNSKKVQSEFCQIKVLDRQLELHSTETKLSNLQWVVSVFYQ